MDITELAQTVKWLEEERLRDKADIQRLNEELQRAQQETGEQVGRIKELEGKVTVLSAQVVRSANVEIAVEKAKRELSLMVQQAESRLQVAERDSVAFRHSERESIMKTVESLRMETQRYAQYEKPIELSKAELQRLGNQLAVLAHRVDEGLSGINNRLQGIGFLEELIRRNERDIRQLQTLDAEIRQQQQLGVDALHLAEIELQRQITVLQKELKAQRTTIDAIAPRIATLQENQQSGRETLEEVKRFEERLQRQQDQASEMQRLAEERQKRELGEWQTENEKRWRRLEVITEQRWTNRQKEHDDVASRLVVVEGRYSGLAGEVDWLWQAQRAFAYHSVSEVQKWIGDFEHLLEEREKSQGTPMPAPGAPSAPSTPSAPTAPPARDVMAPRGAPARPDGPPASTPPVRRG